MNFKGLMIDLETPDRKLTSAILSIAAVQFDISSGRVGSSLVLNIGYENALDSGGTICKETVKWWQDKEPDLYNQQFHPVNPITHTRALVVLDEFINAAFCGIADVEPWGNGACFDISILEYHYHRLGITPPWKYYNVRDVRTICRLTDVHKGDIEFEGNKHDPLDDCLHQIKMVNRAYNCTVSSKLGDRS